MNFDMDIFNMDAFKNIHKEYANICKNTDENINNFSETCSCGSILIKDVSNYMCKNCGLIKDYDFTDSEYENVQKDHTNVGRLRIVGPSSNYYQSDLYRSSNPATSETQKTQILDELESKRLKYIEKNGIAFTKTSIQSAAEYYNLIQRNYVKRNENKKLILANCLKRACRDENFVPSDSVIADFMQLKTKGIAKGENFFRAFVADGKLTGEMNQDSCYPEIETIFMQLGYSSLNEHGEVIEDKYKSLKIIIEKIVTASDDTHTGGKSYKQSKVAGATFDVLRRCKNKSLIAKAPTIKEFCVKKFIRKNTVESFLRILYSFHSKFEPIYIEHNLISHVIIP